MPIFHDVYPPGPRDTDVNEPAEAHREDDAEPDDRRPSSQGRAWTGTMLDGPDGRPISRGELIDRIKRGGSPTWATHQQLRQRSPTTSSPQNTNPLRESTSSSPSPLLPAAEIAPPEPTLRTVDANQAGLELERPKSALHAGDFRDETLDSSSTERRSETEPLLSTSPPAPWTYNRHISLGGSPAGQYGGPLSQRFQPRSRTVSHTPLSSSFVMLPPTSPLVNSSLNSDLEPPPTLPIANARVPRRDTRRHTFSPQSFQNIHHQGGERLLTPPRATSTLRREGTYPYQAHQPRRSISSLSHALQIASSPHTPRLGPRRTSASSDTSPLHHAPMVGSYEESILRGRMSTIPSRPLDFVAQIGVLGRGKCKPSLKCPAHVTVPFPAVFYSYGNGNARGADNQPSPYVGLIDLEHSLKHREAATPSNNRNYPLTRGGDTFDKSGSPQDITRSPFNPPGPTIDRRTQYPKRQSQSPRTLRAPPGGSYRIPPVGQLQIVIKNPHKTAVKLFLVPYDLSDMSSGTKTFIRQRSYSAGPIIDMPLSSRNNLGTDRPEASLSASDDPRERPVLRYLVHLNVCCLGKEGSERYYLFKSIRVVFANRVPDGKEKLRNEIQLPEPRYNVYRPAKEPFSLHEEPRNDLVGELASRRRSTGFTLSTAMDVEDDIAPMGWIHADYQDFETMSPPTMSLAPRQVFSLSRSADPSPSVSGVSFAPTGQKPACSFTGNGDDVMDVDSNASQTRYMSDRSDDGVKFTTSSLEDAFVERRNHESVRIRGEAVGTDERGEGSNMLFRRSKSPLLGAQAGVAVAESLLSRDLRAEKQ